MLLLDRPATELTWRTQADLLTLSRRSLYYQPTPPAAEEVAIKHAIDSIYTAQPSYGSRRSAIILERDHQLVVNRKAVQRHMREMGIVGISPGPNLSRRNPEQRVYPICCAMWSRCDRTRSGRLTSHTFAWLLAGCIWWQCCTFTPAMS